MATPRVLILRAPGTNCDLETEVAFQQAGAAPTRLHVNRLLENPHLAKEFQILCFPGGFSYGDDIAAGRILAVQIKAHLSGMLNDFRTADKLVIGICNGFQIMMRLGIFFDESEQNSPPATLTLNAQGRFEDRWIHMRRTSDRCVFLKDIDQVHLPMAHAEGRFAVRDQAALDRLEANGQLVLRYCRPDGSGAYEPLEFPDNPNGATSNVAGICDASGRIFGLMPHPERYLSPTNHPNWTRWAELPEKGAGAKFFENAVDYFK